MYYVVRSILSTRMHTSVSATLVRQSQRLHLDLVMQPRECNPRSTRSECASGASNVHRISAPLCLIGYMRSTLRQVAYDDLLVRSRLCGYADGQKSWSPSANRNAMRRALATRKHVATLVQHLSCFRLGYLAVTLRSMPCFSETLPTLP
jgi:hypothetical protein